MKWLTALWFVLILKVNAAHVIKLASGTHHLKRYPGKRVAPALDPHAPLVVNDPAIASAQNPAPDDSQKDLG